VRTTGGREESRRLHRCPYGSEASTSRNSSASRARFATTVVGRDLAVGEVDDVGRTAVVVVVVVAGSGVLE